jgi:hypothetical protein
MPESRKFRIKLAEGDSSFIKGFEWIDNALTVEFKNNKKYRYFNVPEKVVGDFVLAESYGKFLHKHIKDKFKGEAVE